MATVSYLSPTWNNNGHEFVKRPILNNLSNQYVTYLDLIKFGRLTNFGINNTNTIEDWPTFFNTISDILIELNNNLSVLESTTLQCTISWDENKGSNSQTYTTIRLSYNSQIGNNIPSHSIDGSDDYGLWKGWYSLKTGGNEITSSTTVPSQPSITYYGRWDTTQYTIHYENTGNTSLSNQSPIYKDYDHYTLATCNDYTDNNYSYRWLGWSYTQNSQTPNFANTNLNFILSNTNNNRIITLYGVWEQTQIKIHLIFHDINGNTKEIDLHAGENLNFNNYNIDNDSNNSTSFKNIDYNINWYSEWIDETHNTKFNKPNATAQIIHGFNGWYTNSEKTGNAITGTKSYDQIKSLNKYEFWAKEQITVKCYTNTGTTNSTNTQYIQLPNDSPTKQNYTFDGWYTDNIGGTQIDNNNNSISINSITSDINYYAHYEEIPITYYWYIGTTDPSTMSSISPIVPNNDKSSTGWREIGPTIPEYGPSYKLWESSDHITINNINNNNPKLEYIAIPAISTAYPRDGFGGNASSGQDNIYNEPYNVTIDNVEYKVYKSKIIILTHDLDIY